MRGRSVDFGFHGFAPHFLRCFWLCVFLPSSCSVFDCLFAERSAPSQRILKLLDKHKRVHGDHIVDIRRAQARDGVLLIKEATRRGYSEAEPGDSVDTSYASQNQKRTRVGHGISYTLTTHADKAVVDTDMRIRRLTPKECLRLQGFSDKQIDKLLAVTSDTQAYKQAGNAVTVNVIHALGLRLQAVWLENAAAGAEKEAA